MRAQESKELEKAAAAITSSILTTLTAINVCRNASHWLVGSSSLAVEKMAEEAWEILNHSKFI